MSTEIEWSRLSSPAKFEIIFQEHEINGLNQPATAEKIGIDKSSISRWLSNPEYIEWKKNKLKEFTDTTLPLIQALGLNALVKRLRDIKPDLKAIELSLSLTGIYNPDGTPGSTTNVINLADSNTLTTIKERVAKYMQKATDVAEQQAGI